jgi:WD40 repeat protein
VWSRENGKLLTTLEGHSSVVNVVRSHPIHRNIVASACDDETIRVWNLRQLEE